MIDPHFFRVLLDDLAGGRVRRVEQGVWQVWAFCAARQSRANKEMDKAFVPVHLYPCHTRCGVYAYRRFSAIRAALPRSPRK
jgi:hypothetical protein